MKEKLAKSVNYERIRGFWMKRISQLIAAVRLAGSCAIFSAKAESGSKAAGPIDFQKDVRPLLESRCYECHGPHKQKSGLRLDRKSSVFQGGDSGKPAVLSGKSSESVLIQKISSKDPDE